MRSEPRDWEIDKVYRRKNKIDPKPPYQRGPVWNEAKKQLLIDTIFRNYDIPKIYLRKLPGGLEFEHGVADGQQRLRAIWDFLDDKFSISKESDPFDNFGDLKGKKYSKLSSDVQDSFCDFGLTIVEIFDASDIEIRDLFLRLQEGVSLNPAEKRNAFVGGMRDFIAELAAVPHPVLPLTKISNKRYDWDDLLAHITCLELAGGATDIKAVNLKKMYENEDDFESTSKESKKIKKVLNYMANTLREEPPEMNIKWGFVDLYLAISVLDEKYILKGHEEDFLSFYISLEKERRAVDDSADLLEDKDPWNRDLYDYIEAFQRDGAKKKNIKARHNVYVKRILRDIPGLITKDPQRQFTRDQKVVLWRRDGGICQKCKKKVKFENMHADHATAHSKGGVTKIENGQTLCGPCNTKKGSK